MMDNLGSAMLCWVQECQALLLAIKHHNLPVCRTICRVPAHSKGAGLGGLLGSFPTQTCDSIICGLGSKTS